jgi:hypothetical protein
MEDFSRRFPAGPKYVNTRSVVDSGWPIRMGAPSLSGIYKITGLGYNPEIIAFSIFTSITE